MEDGDKELELLSTVGKVVDIGNHDQFDLAFEEALHASFFAIGRFSLVPIWVIQGLKEHFYEPGGTRGALFRWWNRGVKDGAVGVGVGSLDMPGEGACQGDR
ncbi:hypothetical protein KSC_072140 [Ktedonobacter sp. SOSP1-52]|nr:hypothetical protein KSC_072140 [Ktedonobacter sp. SOSP1-52]